MHPPILSGQALPASGLAVAPASAWEGVRRELRPQVHAADYWEPADTSKPVTAADVRSLRLFAGKTPVGDRKLAVLHGASEFRAETANALLKLLEEPPAFLTLLLLSEGPHVLPTVASRVRRVPLQEASAIVESGTAGLWGDIVAAHGTGTPAGREFLRQIGFLQPLVHTTIKPETVLPPFARP